MLDISYDLREKFKDDSVHKVFRVSFPNGEYPDLVNDQIVSETVSFTESLCSQNQLKLGLCEANQLTFECVDIGNINGVTIEAFIEIEPENMDYHNEKFYIDDMEVKVGIIGIDIASDSSFNYTEQQALDGTTISVTTYNWINTWKESFIKLTRNGSTVTLEPRHPDAYPLDILYKIDGLQYVVAPVLNTITQTYDWYLWEVSNLSTTSGTDGEPPEPDPDGEAVEWGTWYKHWYTLTAIPFSQFKHKNILAISYGRYIVDSSKRNTSNFKRRQIVAYEDTFASSSSQTKYAYGISDIERMKMECLLKKNTTYGVDAWKFMISNFNMVGLIQQGELTNVTPNTTSTVIRDFMELWYNSGNNFGGYKIVFEIQRYNLSFSKYTSLRLDPSYLYYLEYEYDKRVTKYLDGVYDHIIELYGENGSLKPISPSYTYNHRVTKDLFIKSAKQHIAMDYHHYDRTTNKDNIVPSDNVITTLERDTNIIYPWANGIFCDANNTALNVYSELIIPISIKVLIYDRYYPGYTPQILYPTSQSDPYYNPQDVRTNFTAWQSNLEDCDAEIQGDRSRVTRTYLNKKKKGYTAESFEEELLKDNGQKLRNYLQSIIEIEGKFGRQDRQTYEFELYSLRTMFHTIYPHSYDETFIRLSEVEDPTTHEYVQMQPDDWYTNYYNYYIKTVDKSGNITYIRNRETTWAPESCDYYRYNPDAPLYPAQPYINDNEAESLYPQGPAENIYASNYSKLWYDDIMTKKFGRIICKYKESKDSNDTDMASYWFNGYTDQHYYELQYVEPSDWTTNYTNYFTYNAENYTLQNYKPSNWTRRYYMYYTKNDNNEYIRVEGIKSGKKIKAPKWKNNKYYFRGLYEITNSEPDNWDDDWDSYYTYDTKRKRYKSVSSENKPSWVANKYYRITINSYDPVPSVSVPPWAPYTYYTQRDLVGDDYLTYDLSQNTLIQDYPWVSSDIQETLETIAYELGDVQYYPTEMTMVGLPYLEAGDTLQIITPNDSFNTIILRRTLKGIQSLKDTIEAR